MRVGEGRDVEEGKTPEKWVKVKVARRERDGSGRERQLVEKWRSKGESLIREKD